jgi:hypothetical protein
MAIYRVTRTSTPNLAPASGTLVPGQLAVEMATQPNPRLWVGVPTNIDPTGRRLIVSTTGGGGGGIPDAPTDGAIYGRDGETETWVQVLPLTGGTMQGPLVLNGDASLAMQALPLGQVASFLGFPVQPTAPNTPDVGDLWFNSNTGQLEQWNGTAWVPATAGFLPISGGAMTGNLILDGPPSEGGNPDQAATRGYVDSRITGSVQFIGTIDAQSGVVTYTVSSGITGTVLVDPTTVKDTYVICSVSGTLPATYPFLPGQAMQVGDWVISDGTDWFLIQVSGEVVLASEVSVAPSVLGATDVQTALEALLANFTLYAPLASPSLEGIPTTPTPPVNDHSLQIANTSWVQAMIAQALLTPGGNVDNVLMIGDITGAESIAGSGDFFDQLSLSGDSSGSSASTLPNYITAVSLTSPDASSLP